MVAPYAGTWRPPQPDKTGTGICIPVTNPIERLNGGDRRSARGQIKRRTEVVGIFPNEAAITRLVGAILLEQNDEWQLQHRYMGVKALAELLNPPATNETLQLPPKAA